MNSKVIEAEIAFRLLDKIFWKLYQQTPIKLNKELENFDDQNLALEDKTNRKYSSIREYFGFESSFCVLLGILKTAAQLNYKIQIVAEYY